MIHIYNCGNRIKSEIERKRTTTKQKNIGIHDKVHTSKIEHITILCTILNKKKSIIESSSKEKKSKKITSIKKYGLLTYTKLST